MTSALSQLRFPRPVVSATVVGGALLLVWVFAYPRSSRDDIRLVTAQVMTGAWTLFMSAVAMFCALWFLIRRTPIFAVIYSWSALAVVASGAAFLSLGYSPLALDFRRSQRDLPELQLLYDAIRVALWVATVALLPAVIAHVVHLLEKPVR